ncbi:MAG: hypothetical protein K9G76_02160 [Bacteroidales bacterium]|nr:hypothetical protein [Bacteroidales bacterium]MCF8404853.1 hypothetical protein [Bacteroidales bacterium]
MIKDNQKKFDLFRKEFQTMVFEGYKLEDFDSNIRVSYHYNLADQYHFYPVFSIEKKEGFFDTAFFKNIEGVLFNIGMVELISYWKTACPPKVVIKPYRLSNEQQIFWKKLFYNGLGEFFYLNNINPTKDNLVSFVNDSEKEFTEFSALVREKGVLVPVGGGKDSVVTLELLKGHFDIIPFIMNPREASLQTCYNAGFERNNIFEVKRSIDPLLLELNEKGFLNGHTPFSALLAFHGVLAAGLANAKFIALSNESSANEPTVVNGANHQYSKSLEFENDFRDYSKNFLTSDISYFSFLRPLSEYYIAKIFANYTQYFSVFRSCNVGSKANEWCGKCPKCLFTFIMLAPYVKESELFSIFNKDLFADENLKAIMNELIGVNPVKPFECVGTVDEVNLALQKTIETRGGAQPALLKYYFEEVMPDFIIRTENEVLHFNNENHNLPDIFFEILKDTIHAE